MTAPAPTQPPALLRIDKGAALLEIEDHTGELHDYSVAPAAALSINDEVWACALTRLDGKGSSPETPHRLALSTRGRWSCTCEDAKYRPQRRGRCIHATALAPFYEQHKRLFPKEITSMPSEPPPDPRADVLARIASALAAPFDAPEVKFKPATVSGNRALALPYVDARVIQDRLDDVLGVLNWQDSYECLSDGAVVCRLKIRLGDEWITKEDVGGESEQPDGGDRRKAAFSDALKRAAVKFGVGRYLYRQKPQWCDYDPQKRQFVRPPMLSGVAPAAAAGEVARQERYGGSAVAAASWHVLLQEYDAKLAEQGLCRAGDLVKHVAAEGKNRGYPADMTAWGEVQVAVARGETKRFEAERREAALKQTA